MSSGADDKDLLGKEAVARANRAIAAAEAILLPLGFIRHINKGAEATFNAWAPAQWFFDSPRMRAALRYQANSGASRDGLRFIYRLELSGDSALDVRSVRVAPGNREAVASHITKLTIAQGKQATRLAGYD